MAIGKRAWIVGVVCATTALAVGCGGTGHQHPNSNGQSPTASQPSTQSGVDRSQAPMPNSSLTPGATFPDATAARICRSGYARSVRDVPSEEKRQVYDEYRIRQHTPGQYEVDHLISLELGGSNDIKNLWPEPYTSPAGAHEKDGLENYLHDQVCSGRLPLAQAQQEIARDWYGAWLQAGKPMPKGKNGQ